MSGIGGGIIAKPLLDIVNIDSVETINFLSSSTVLAMAIMSLLIILYSKKVIINFRVVGILAISSILGGVLGKKIFNRLLVFIDKTEVISFSQSIILVFLMIFILTYQRQKYLWTTFKLKKVFNISIIGVSLGLLSSFLGIGGGAFNVAVLTLFFSMQSREASINSLFIIFFSQISSILTTITTTGVNQINLSMLPFMIVGGLLGGLLGSMVLFRMTNHSIDRAFNSVLVVITLINLHNAVKLIPAIF